MIPPATRDLLGRFCCPENGLLDVVGEWPAEPDGPDFFYYQAAVRMPHARPSIQLTAGVAATRERALLKAVGEAVERYCGALGPGEDRLIGSYRTLPGPAVPPEAFALFSPEQYRTPGFPFHPFHDDTVISWSPARDAKSGEALWLPSCAIYVPYTFLTKRGERPVLQPISTGLAAHRSPTAAAANAILEVIERDAVAITWQASLAKPRIDLRTVGAEHRDCLAKFRKAGYEVQVVYAANELPLPTFLAVMRGSAPGQAPLTLGAATHPDKNIALTKCLEELALMERALRASLPGDDPGPLPDFNRVLNFQDQLALWARPDFAHHADFLLANPRELDFGDLPGASYPDAERLLRDLVELVDTAGYRVLLADLTPAHVEALGFNTVRAVIPGFHPIASGHPYRALGGRRLWTIPQRLGYPGIDPAGGDNPLPCPFT